MTRLAPPYLYSLWLLETVSLFRVPSLLLRAIPHAWCPTGHTAVVKLLAEWNADLHLSARNGCTPLRIALQHGPAAELSSGLVQTLIEHKVDVNHTDMNGCTAVLAEAEQGNDWAVAFLKKLGADLYLSQHDGNTSISVSAEKGHESGVMGRGCWLMSST